MMTKKFTQLGTICIAVFLPILIIEGIVLFKLGVSHDPKFIILCLVWLLLFLCLLTFYKMAITIDNHSIFFKFGIGWFGKTYPLSEIESCEAVKNPILVGIGIRYLGNGWLYNVSGLKAIELRFKNKNSIVRIGTNKPEEICEVIRKKLTERNE